MENTVEAFGRTWKRVWVEDEALRHIDGERVDAAWLRLFGEPMPTRRLRDCPTEDWGDTFAHLVGERVVLVSYDGDSIWIEDKS